jgi:hypothetical protein
MNPRPRMGYRSEYFLLLNDAILIDCCAAMKDKLSREWHMEVLRHTLAPETPIRHCGLICLNELALTEIK